MSNKNTKSVIQDFGCFVFFLCVWICNNNKRNLNRLNCYLENDKNAACNMLHSTHTEKKKQKHGPIYESHCSMPF